MVSFNPGNGLSEDDIMRQLQELDKNDNALIKNKGEGVALQGEGAVDIGAGGADVGAGGADVGAGVNDVATAAAASKENTKATLMEKQVEILANTGINIPSENLQILYEPRNDDGRNQLLASDPADREQVDLNQYQVAGIRDRGSQCAHLFDGSRAHQRQEAEKKQFGNDPNYVPRGPRVVDVNGKSIEVREWGRPVSSKFVKLFVDAAQVARVAISLQLRNQEKLAESQRKDKERAERIRAETERDAQKHLIPLRTDDTTKTSPKQGHKYILASEKAKKNPDLVGETLHALSKQQRQDRFAHKISRNILKKEEIKSEEQKKADLLNGIKFLEQHSFRVLVLSDEVLNINTVTKQSTLAGSIKV